MDRHQRIAKDQSVLASQESSSVARVTLIIGLLLGACTTAPKSLVQPPPQDYLLLKGARQVTLLGDNDSPSFSPAGNKLLFVSRQRSGHRNTQVYEFDLLRNVERRITFQDGEVRNPAYIDDETIMYASNTDEIKENWQEIATTAPASPGYSSEARQPSDLYQSDLFGNDIERLTFFPGYDDEPNYIVSDKKPYLLFTSFRNGFLGIYKYDFKFKNAAPYLVEKGKERWSPTVSSDDKFIAWIEKDLAKKSLAIFLSPVKELRPRLLKEIKGEVRDLHFIRHSSKLIYSARVNKDDVYHIEMFDFEKTCTQVVFSGKDSLVQPAYSPGSPDRVVFTRVLKESKQIYLVDVPADLGPCLETIPHVK